MSEAPETVAEPELTTVERLARFIDVKLGDQHALSPDVMLELAAEILTGFFRVEDAKTIYAIPGVSADGTAFVSAHWGPLVGQLTPAEARQVGYAWLETAETAEIEAAMFSWLMRAADATDEGVTKILREFRLFRLEREDV